MKTSFFLLFITLTSVGFAQNNFRESNILKSPKANTGKPPTVVVQPYKTKSNHGRLLDSIKIPIDLERQKYLQQKGVTYKTNAATDPLNNNGFTSHFQQGIPNDNNIAISNSGKIVSVSNSIVSVYDETGNQLMAKTLRVFANSQLNLNGPFDPHVLYDPIDDRFVMVFLDGSSSIYSQLIVAFSASNDPTGNWHFYALPGNVHGDDTWSDYPFPALSTEELFISVLLWHDGESGWDSEATNELIWQIDKKKGYAGDSLIYKYYDSLTVNNRQVWNTRPIKGGSTLYGPKMYLLANRAIDTQNDSIFLFEITNTIASGKATITTTVLKSNIKYGIPPSAIQPNATNVLRTNYADIQDGFIENGIVQFVANSIDTNTMAPAIYYGQITNLNNNPIVSAQLFSSDTIDLNYPSIAYAGNSQWDQSALVNCLHTSANTFPGTSVFYTNGKGNFSNLVRVKSGEGFINSLSGNLERWGDYTGIQRKYNKPGTCWLMGSFGKGTGSNPQNWVAEISSQNPNISIEPHLLNQGFMVFPNPAHQTVYFKITSAKAKTILITLVDLWGKTWFNETQELAIGENKLLVNVENLENGTYILNVRSNDSKTLLSKKIEVNE